MAERRPLQRAAAVLVAGLGIAAAAAAESDAAGTTLWFNQGALAPLGLRLDTDCGGCADAGLRADYRELRFAVAAGAGLRWRRAAGRFEALQPGRQTHRGGPRLRLADGSLLNLDGFALRQRGGARVALDLVDGQGRAWFTLDHAHVYVDEAGALSLRHMDLRVGAALAQRLARPETDGLLVGGAQSDALAAAADVVAPTKQSAQCAAVWPGASAQADVQMLRLAQNWELRQPDGVNAYRCGRSDGFGGHSRICTADSDDGLVVLAPDASLRNVGTAAVAWYAKFSPPAPPYGNDQHPFLVWNLYRLDADGRLRQLGASAAKHAFHTINAVCDCGDGNVLYPGCEDTYGGFSNDYPTALAPRSEIVPYGARWGRCGSLYDKDCDGQRDADDGLLPDDAFHPAKRLGVAERELLPARHPGARWFVEYWYLVRDDAEPWNNFGLMQVTPQKRRGQGSDPDAYAWSFEVAGFHNESMVQHWAASPPDGAWQRRAVVQTAQGRALLVTRVTARSDGRYAYVYELFNLDLMLARTRGAEPDLRIEENRGIERFAVFADARAQIDAIEFAGAAADAAAWPAARDALRVNWTRGATQPALDWGTTFRFAFVSDLAPRDSTALLGSGAESWTAATLAPRRDWEPPPRRAVPPSGN
ncbi:MAG: hypothetical protein BGP24_21235 [Lysobacterales bacterium 69-70]|nr:hypothetical protein [Xanthomonadaceae bacterium]ODV15728.1 MAG: hypothetical protein ABT27_22065 [Xanthomonadaceae bacterium SCN 69-25]OJZ01356.1 MAG: hypothetical protein BGP24_21235 [Xanthomonadales bacterium 69-70]